MPKEGYIREDGMVYWRYCKRRGEIWVKPEVYQAYHTRRKNYHTMCRQDYHRRQEMLSPMDRNYFGKYDFATNLYFVDVSSTGKEVWFTKQQFDKMVEMKKGYRRKYKKKMQNLPKKTLRFGDQNPDNPNEYVTHFLGNLPRFGTKEQLEKRIKSSAIASRKSKMKMKKIRNTVLSSIKVRIRRGTVDTATGLVFWVYNQVGIPKWITADDYKSRKEKESNRKKLRKQKSKVN